MKQRCLVSVLMVCLALGLAVPAVWMTGCEPADGVTGLILSPESATITPTSNVVTFTVISITNELALPLTWSVANPSLGTILTYGGYSAVYHSTASSGRNTVLVEDQ